MQSRLGRGGDKTVERIHKGLSRCHHHIGISGMTGLQLPIASQADGDLTHGVNAFGHRLD